MLDFAGSGEGHLALPGRSVDLEDTITITDVGTKIRGAGLGATTVAWQGTTGVQTLLYFKRTISNISALYQVSDLTFSVSDAYTGVGINAEEVRVNDGTDTIVGGLDFLYLDNVNFTTSGDGYWVRFLQLTNAGGAFLKRVFMRNSNGAAVQATSDSRTKAIFILNSQSNIWNIRTLTANQFYVNNVYNGIELSVAKSIESLYLGQFEMANMRDGILVTGTGKMGATHIDGGHMNVRRSGVFANPTGGMNIVRLTGADIRRSNLGGDYEMRAAVQNSTTVAAG